MKKKEFWLIIGVIAFGVIYNSVRTGGGSFLSGCSYRPTKVVKMAKPARFPQKEILFAGADGIDKLEINNPAGDITVEKSKDGSIRIQPVIRVHYKNKKKAASIAQKVEVLSRQNGNKLMVGVDSDGKFLYRRIRIDFTCFIPEQTALKLKTRYGSVDVSDAGRDIVIDQKDGDLFVKNIASGVTATHRDGRVRLYDIDEAVELSTRDAKGKIKNVASLLLKCRHSNLTISGVAEETEITDASYSSLEIENTHHLYVDARHTHLDLDDIKDSVRITNTHAGIIMKNIAANINVTAKACAVSLDASRSDSVIIKNSFNDIDIRNVSAQLLDILLKQGDLDVTIAGIEEKINIKGEHADITLKYPATLTPGFNITADNGKIKNNTSVDYTVQEDHQRRIINTAGSKPEVVVDTLYGSVTLKHSPAGAAPPPS